MRQIVPLALGLAMGTWSTQAYAAYQDSDWWAVGYTGFAVIVTLVASVLFIDAD